MKKFKIEFWYRTGDEKDFSEEIIEAIGYLEAVEIIRNKYPQIHIFKTYMKPL